MTLLGRSATCLPWPTPVQSGAVVATVRHESQLRFEVREFRRASATVNPMTPAAASALVRSGVYRRTRNPDLGMLLMLAGWAVWLRSIAAGPLLPLSSLYMNRLQIVPESARWPVGSAGLRGLPTPLRRWI